MKSHVKSRVSATHLGGLCGLLLILCTFHDAHGQNILANRTPAVGGTVELRNATQATVATVPPGTFANLSANVNDIIEVDAIPASGYQFVRWDGSPPAGNQQSQSFLYFADINRAITAIFEPVEPLRLIITKVTSYDGAGDGDLFVSVNGGPSVPYDPAAEYLENDSVMITAVPVPVGPFDSFMLEWRGDVPDSLVPIEDLLAPHSPVLSVIMTDNREITVTFSHEYHPGEGVGDLDLDGLPDRWELRYRLDPRDPTGDDGPDGNIPGDMSMPTGWTHNQFASGAYPAAVADIVLEGPYRFHIDGSRPLNYYVGSQPFNNWLRARGFDGWYGNNPITGINDDPHAVVVTPGVNPNRLSTAEDGIPDGWKYWFYGSARNSTHPSIDIMEGERLDYTLFDPDVSWDWDDLKVVIPNANILAMFTINMGVNAEGDLDNDCLTMLEEFLNGTDPIHWDTDGDGISDGYELRTGLNPLNPDDGDANLSNDHMAYYEDNGTERRHLQVYDDLGFDPRTGWGENYLSRGTVRELRSQVNSIPFHSREKYMASVYLAWRSGEVFNCQNFDKYALDPLSIDTDNDGMFDGWELYVGLNPKNPDDADIDQDDDGITNFQEFSAYDIDLIRGTPWPNGRQHFDPAWRNKVWPTDPNNDDTDGDGVLDGAEGGYRDLDVPEGIDTEGSLAALKYAGDVIIWNNSSYVGGGMNPTSVDTSGDGIPDHWSAIFRSTIYDIEDLENRNGMDPTLKDAHRDYDQDGLLNYQEYLVGAVHHWRYTEWIPGLPLGGYDPLDYFTGIPYEWDWHVEQNLVPFFFIEKVNNRYSSTNPRRMDTDGDGIDDFWKIYHGLNPLYGVRDVHASMVVGGTVFAGGEPPTHDIRVSPYVAGHPFTDPDQDDLLNVDESLQPNTPLPFHHHTGPSPHWVTDTSYQLSWVNLYYSLGSLYDHWWYGGTIGAALPPTYLFSFASNEGYDTDGDMLSDYAELSHTPSSPGTTDPLRTDSPPRRRALYLNGNAAARTRGTFLHDRFDLKTFTVEAWARPVNPASGVVQVVVERPIKVPGGKEGCPADTVVRNFRIALNENGAPFFTFDNLGCNLLHPSPVAQAVHPLEADRWYHLAAVYDGEDKMLYLYIDGVMRASEPSSLLPANGWGTGTSVIGVRLLANRYDAPLVIGAADNRPNGWVSGTPILVGTQAGAMRPEPDLDLFFEGWIDEVRIWNGARSTDEIRSTMKQSLRMDDAIATQPEPGFLATEPELMYLYTFNNLLDPIHEGIIPEGFDFVTARPNDGSYPHVPWWGTAADRSLVYNNYHYIPWIANLAARAPLDPPSDSPFHRSTFFVQGFEFERIFPNTANPYNFGYIHGVDAFDELHPDFHQFIYDPQRSSMLNDLLPLRFARVDASIELWDNHGTGLDPFDSNGDGIPDWWYLEHGFDPLGPSIAEGDPNQNGINNYWTYRLGANPHDAFSLDPAGIISDADWDSDGDGLSNYDEINIYFTDPTNPDTDDDEIPDGVEVLKGHDPRSSVSPFVFRALRFGANNGVGIVRVPDRIGLEDTERHSLSEWTIETQVKPSAYPVAGRVSLISRRVELTGRRNYEIGLTHEGKPYVRFDSGAGILLLDVPAGAPLPLNEWSHVAARFDRNAGIVSLIVNGIPAASTTSSLLPAEGPGDLVFGGDGYRGDLKEIRIWNIPRSDADLETFRNRTLFFGASAIDPGVLRTFGDIGHLRQNSSTINPATGAPIDSLGDGWTLEAWVKTTSSSAGDIIARWNTSTAGGEDFNYYLGMTADGRLLGRWALAYAIEGDVDEDDEEAEPLLEVIFDFNVNNIEGATRINDGEWHHVAYVRDATRTALFVDGILDATQSRTLVPVIPEPIVASAVRRLPGPLTVGYQLSADIDEVRVWNRGLPAAELNLYNKRSLVGNEPGLITYFNFNFQRGDLADERADVRNGEEEPGLYIPSAMHVRTDDIPPIEVEPVSAYRLVLPGYFSADDGGETLEDFTQPLDWDYAGILSNDVHFAVLDSSEFPFQGDSNQDGLPDWWKTLYGLDPGSSEGIHGPWGDPDRDGLPNIAEFHAGTNPRDFDTARDGFSDFDSRADQFSRTWGEIYTDMDGMAGEWEVRYPGTVSPLVYDAHLDPDGDGWSNFAEFMADTDPSDPLSYPTPLVPVFLHYEGPNRVGPVRVYVYGSESMDGVPDAVGTLGASVDVSNDNVGSVVAPGNIANGTIPTAPIVPGTVEIRIGCFQRFMVFVDQGNGVLRSQEVVPTRFGEIDYESGEWSVNLSPSSFAPDTTVCASWSYFIGVPSFPFKGTMAITQGRLREGPAWFFAYIDNDGDVDWTPGEPAGLAQGQPHRISWNEAEEITIHLKDSLPGYHRFRWEPEEGKDTFVVRIRRLTGTGPVVMTVTNYLRNYIHEGDYLRAGHLGLPAGSVFEPSFQWNVNGSPWIVENFLVDDWSSTLSSTTLVGPVGPVVFSRNEFVWSMDANTTAARIQIRSGSAGGPVVFDRVIPAPGRGPDGLYRYDLPLYAGDDTLLNGVYYWRVTAINPMRTSVSAYSSFAVNLVDAPPNAHQISGDVWYFGRAPAENIIVQAFQSPCFSGRPDAQITRDASGPYTLRGLRAGTYYVRAFIDQTGDKTHQVWESGGFVKDYIYGSDFEVKPITVGPANQEQQRLVIRDRDTNQNGVPDAWEYAIFGTLANDANLWDDDGDGIPDWEEIFLWGTDPYNADTSGDGLTDGQKVAMGLNPVLIDSDGDGYSDAIEIVLGSDPTDPGSIPTTANLLAFVSIVPGAQTDVITYDFSPAVTNVYTNVTLQLRSTSNLMLPFSPVNGSRRDILAPNWTDGPWSFTNQPVSDNILIYQIDWKIKGD